MKMKVGIDSYCYHRLFGEVYPGQKKPDKLMTMDDFLDRANAMGVDGVSLESCFFPGKRDSDGILNVDEGFLKELRAKLDEYKLERVYAWGHPDGLFRGQNEAEFKDMLASIPRANMIGATVMRVCGSSLMFRHEPHQPQIKALVAQFKEAVKVAESYGIKIANENHIDYTADEMLQMIEEVGSPNYGINFDTGNFLRLLDDPIAGMEKLAPYTFATHIKDLVVNPTAKPTDWFFFSGVPVGRGLIDNLKLAELLKKANYQGFLAVEIDNPHPDWQGCEDEAVSISVKALRDITDKIG